MEWTADVSAGDWIRERLDNDLTASMHSVVPHGFPAYARIFHPATRERPVGRAWPPLPYARHAREWESFQAAQPQVDVERVSWADTAQAFGREMHELAQWHRLAVRDDAAPVGEDGPRDAAGWRYGDPVTGGLEIDLVSTVASVLAAHTSTPGDGFAAVWDGHGGIVGGMGYGPSRVLLTPVDGRSFTDESTARHGDFLANSVRDSFNDVFRKPTWQPGVLPDDVSRGSRLSLPGREHVLFRAAVTEFVDADWPRRAPWADAADAASGFVVSPSLVWPTDRAWVMVTEVDFDSTIVAGTADLVRALCSNAVIEARALREGADLTWDADEVNR